ncbi:MAG: MCE family protein [Haloechinothrix sp.]
MTPFRQRNPVKVGVIGAVIMLVAGFAALNWEELPIVGGTVYTAEFAEAAGLKPDNEVRVGGVKVGKVTDVALAGDRVLVSFRIKGAWIGDKTTAAIKIKTLLGQKTLALEPYGSKDLDPENPIPLARTTTPYDVNDAFGELSKTVGHIDTDQLATAFSTLAQTFDASTTQDVRAALTGLASLSETISSRDEELRKLLDNTHEISKTMASQSGNIAALITDGRTLLAEIRKRRESIGLLLDGTRDLAKQIDGVVADNNKQLGPALEQLERVTVVLQRNQDNMDKSLRLAGPFYRIIGSAVDSGPWIDTYLCGLIKDTGVGAGCQPPKPKGHR